MTNKLRPLLATEVKNLKDLKLPMLASVKLDGIYALIVDGVIYSRSFKPIKNKHVQKLFGNHDLNGLVGELVCGDVYAEDVFRQTTTATMAEYGVNDVKLYVFDDWSVGDKPYQERYQHYQRRIKALNHGSIVALEHNMLHTIDEVITALDKEQKRNGEGIILRLPSAKWKNGRSTPKSQESVKLKFFEQQEYKIVDVVERMHNANEARVNEIGYTERSSHKDNMIPMNTFGAFVMELQDGRNFNVGSGLGLTDAVRKEIWNNRDEYIGKIATVRQMKVGSKNGIPRLPTFVGLRDSEDMS